MIALEIIEQAQTLPEGEQMEIVIAISQKLSAAADKQLSKEEKGKIESVLLGRVDGPFEQVTKKEFDARVEAAVSRLNAIENG